MVTERGLCLVLVLGVCLAACQTEDPPLWGDINATFDLEADRVRAYRLGDRLAVLYERAYDPPGMATSLGRPVMNQVARLTLLMDATSWKEGRPRFDQPRLGFIDRHVVAKNADGDLIQTPPFPVLARGEVTFERLGDKEGDPLRGAFDCVFINDRTLGGRFDGQLSRP